MSINLTLLRTMLLTAVVFVSFVLFTDVSHAQSFQITAGINNQAIIDTEFTSGTLSGQIYRASNGVRLGNFHSPNGSLGDNPPYDIFDNYIHTRDVSAFPQSQILVYNQLSEAGNNALNSLTLAQIIAHPSTEFYIYLEAQNFDEFLCGSIDDQLDSCLASNATWGGDGFWGSAFTTDDVSDTLEASVQATGADLWPLLVFVGIAIAFIIFLQMVFLVNHSVKPKKFDSEKFNKKADELTDFYSKKGGASDEIVDSIRRSKK